MNFGQRSPPAIFRCSRSGLALGAMLSAVVLVLAACVPETAAPPPRVEASSPPPEARPPAPAPAPVPKIARPLEPPPAGQPEGAGGTQIVIGILLPLSGGERELGRAMLNGAMMAVFDHAEPGFAFKPYDTGGTAAGAVEAAQAALKEGARLLLGPLFSDSVAAVAPVAKRVGVNVIAFTNDRAAAGQGVFVLGHHVAPQIRAVIAYARTRGIRSLAVLIPTGRFGAQAAVAADSAAREAGIRVHEIAAYADDVPSIDRAVRRLARYDGRKAALREHRGALKRRGDPESLAILERLKNRDTLGDVGFDAILVPSGSSPVYAIAARLPYYDIPSDRVRVLGISTWDRLELRYEPALRGAWYATPATELGSLFKKRFARSFGKPPGPLAALAYDAAAVAALLGRRPGADFSARALVDARGFEGASGLFRFRADGLSERSYAIVEVGEDGVKPVRPASRTFDAPRVEARLDTRRADQPSSASTSSSVGKRPVASLE